MQKTRIMVVDDEAPFSRLIKTNLEATGQYVIREENDGIRALETAREFKPGLIFLDLMMPRINGGQIAFQLQSDPTLCDTPIIFLTGSVPQRGNYHHDEELAGFPFLVKPVNFEELMRRIETTMKKTPPCNLSTAV